MEDPDSYNLRRKELRDAILQAVENYRAFSGIDAFALAAPDKSMDYRPSAYVAFGPPDKIAGFAADIMEDTGVTSIEHTQ